MHRIFRNALDEATGISQSLIAVFIDIRGFSAFSTGCDSVDTAMFLKRAYIELIDSYFPFASFYKSTGDGLLFTIQIIGNNLSEISRKVVSTCIKCHNEFGSICDGDHMVNFKVPNRIGIGIARGTASCLVSGDKIIDYSGRLLNLASRLTNLARPSGIVIDGGFNIGLLAEEQRSIFQEEKVYIEGIHEEESIKIYFTPEFTSIPEYNKKPIKVKIWKKQKDTLPYRELLKLRTRVVKYKCPLETKPANQDDIKVTVEHLTILNGKMSRKYLRYYPINYFTYELEGNSPYIVVDLPKLCSQLEGEQVKKNMNVTLVIDYVEK